MNDSGIHDLRESTPRLVYNPLDVIKQHINLPSPIVPIHSSTLNESLLNSVESWNIYNYSPKFYVEDANTNTTDAASTSGLSSGTSSHSPSPTEFYKNHQACMQRTPIKHLTSTKLGSPERNEIINGRKPTSMTKWITPKAERSSPAKKRLFGLHHINGTGITKSKSLLAQHTKHDPIAYFMKRRNVGVVVEKVFSYLRDADLYNCKRVSRNWLQAVGQFPAVRTAVDNYSNKLEVNKENPKQLRHLFGKQSPNKMVTTTANHFDKFIELAQTLNENQTLNKCPCCQQPQIVEYNIGQCQNLTCGYICCLQCNSYSCDGPEHFVDQCNGSALDMKKPKRRTLLDSPPHSQLSFLSSSRSDNSHLYANSNKDSCYGSYDESQFGSFASSNSSLAHINLDYSNNNVSSSAGKARKSLGDSNREQTNLKRQSHRNSLYIPVVKINANHHNHNIGIGSKSPERLGSEYARPGDEYKGAGTMLSKKRLRRLLK